MSSLPLIGDASLLVGPRTNDDAGIYQLNDELALVQTLDFFTPITDDPREFGRIAAVNSLSDVYAMGGKPVTAMNIVCYPATNGEHEPLREILMGALEACNEADCVVAGGHTVDDEIVKFGLSVTGLVHPKKYWANSGAKPGDALVLTKPLGTGIVVTALLAELDEEDHALQTFESMKTLNRSAAESASDGDFTINGATDITGFGLVGHCVEMALASRTVIRLKASSVPKLPGVFEYASMGLVPAGAYRNRQAYESNCLIDDGLAKETLDLLHDPQTSGGLLFSLPAQQADELVESLQIKGVSWASRVGDVLSINEAGERANSSPMVFISP